MKRGADSEAMEIIQSPQKKFKNIESNENQKRRTAERLRKMSIKECCLMVERAIYAKEDLQEIPFE